MHQPSYEFSHNQAARYKFRSEGPRSIEKIVEFTPTTFKNIFNLAFGDLLPDGTIDDIATSNNGDLAKVLSTVVKILDDFTTRYPRATVYFAGSTAQRTRLYGRIIKTYHSLFKSHFDITVIIKGGGENGYRQLVFDPLKNLDYTAFLIKRIA